MNPINGEIPQYFYKENNQFDQPIVQKNISNFCHTMSGGKFKMTADVFKDPATGKPVRINIGPYKPCIEQNTDGSTTVWNGGHNQRVMVEIKKKYPNFDWSKYDKRKNKESSSPYKIDNNNVAPDGVPDYVVIVYRKSNSWTSTWAIKNKTSDAVAALGGINSAFTIGLQSKYRFTEDGFTMFHGDFSGSGFNNLFLHELSHRLYNCPHYSGANGAFCNRFHGSIGLGMMSYGDITSSALAWECWLLGWSDIKYDLNDATPTSTITLRDFVDTKDAVRIKIPGSTNATGGSQYLWIQNHSSENTFNKRDGVYEFDGKRPIGSRISTVPKGLYMYIEGMEDKREDFKLIWPMGNQLHTLHAGGHHDYEYIGHFALGTENYERAFTNTIINWKQSKAKPTGNEHYMSILRLNKPASLEPKTNIIEYSNAGNGGSGNECATLFCENSKMT